MGGIVDALTGGGSRDAADAQVQAAGLSMEQMEAALKQSLEFMERGLETSKEQFQIALDLGEPYRAAGSTALAQYESLLYGVPVEQTSSYQSLERQRAIEAGEPVEDLPLPTGMPSEDAEQFRMDELLKTPGYQFRLEQGQKALERSASARSGTLTGAQSKALTRYGQDVATQEFDKILDRLSGVISTGAEAAGAGAAQAIQTGTQEANILGGMADLSFQTGQGLAGAESQVGAARASGYLGTQAAGENILNAVAGFAGSTYTGGGWTF